MANPQNLRRGGRRPGQTNLATRRRLALEEAASRALVEKLGSEDVTRLDAIDVLTNIMHACYAAGDMQGARVAATELAVYTHARKSAEAAQPGPLPEDLQPDPVPQPDEPGPESPVL